MKFTYWHLAILIIMIGCKKPSFQDNAQPIEPTPVNANRVIQPCFYTKLNLQSDGSYSCLFEGLNITFRNLGIRQGGYLYGDLVNAENAVVLSGEQSRTFAIKGFYCAVSGPMVTVTSKTISFYDFNNKTTNNSYAYFGNGLSDMGNFLLDIQNSLEVGLINFTVTPNSYVVKTYRIGDGITENCSKSKVIAGKLVVKSTWTSGRFVYEWGVANLCYVDGPQLAD